jgi:hypothetical protein
VAVLSGLVEVMAAMAAYGEIVRRGRGGGGSMWRLCQDWLRCWRRWRQRPEFLRSGFYLMGQSHDIDWT